MYFTSGSDRAFEQLMQGKPGFDHYDSGEAVTPEDCGTCRFYRPHWKYQFCVYAECPYQPGKLTAYDAVTFRVKGVENMAVFRVERNKGYTVMSNHHLRNKDLSLKAKGLLSQMLSLPEDWDYTLKGLSLINREQIDAIRAAIRELEQAGYIVRSRERDSQGRLRGADYVIYEQPQPVPDSPTLENPMLDILRISKPVSAGIGAILLPPRQSLVRSPLWRPIQRLNCVACRYLFRCLSASCFRRIRTAQSGQYFARLDFGVNAAPHTAHRFTLSRLWMISAYSAPSSGRTAARNHRHSNE